MSAKQSGTVSPSETKAKPVSDINELLQNLRAEQVYDYLRVAGNADLRRFLSAGAKKTPASKSMTLETVQFSDEVVKINERGKHQTRALIVTNAAVYNFAPKKYSTCKRRIPLADLKTIVLSRSSDEMVFQVDKSYDYRFIVQRRAEVLEMINKFYEQETKQKLEVLFSEESQLTEHCITKTQMGKRDSKPVNAAQQQAKMSTESRNRKPSLIVYQKSEEEITNSASDRNATTTSGFRSKSTRMEGWLTKQKGTSKVWDRKYFVLLRDKLQYFTPRIKGNLLISSKSVVERILEKDEGMPDQQAVKVLKFFGITNDYKRFRLRIKSDKNDRPLIAAAESQADLDRWLLAFKKIIATDYLAKDQSQSSSTVVHLEGWLMKQDNSSKSWERRYFILFKDRLWFYEMVHKGTIDLTNGVSGHSSNKVSATEESRKNFAGLMSQTRFAYRWDVSDASRIFHLSADSEGDMVQWIEAVEKASREYTKGAISDEKSAIPESLAEAITQEAPTGQVTFVFTDVQSSTTLWEKVPDAMEVALEQHDRILRELLKKFRGYEVKTEGDAFMVAFFSVLEAVLWCMAVQEALFNAEWSDEFLAMPAASKEYRMDNTGKPVAVYNGIRIRMGVHTGQPNCRRNPVTGRMDYFGPVVNRSARVSDTAHGGQIVCTLEVYDNILEEKVKEDKRLQGTYPMFTDCGEHNLKGIQELVRIFQLLPPSLQFRPFPPLRTENNERKEKEQEQEEEAKALSDANKPITISVAATHATPHDGSQPNTPLSPGGKTRMKGKHKSLKSFASSESMGVSAPVATLAAVQETDEHSAAAHAKKQKKLAAHSSGGNISSSDSSAGNTPTQRSPGASPRGSGVNASLPGGAQLLMMGGNLAPPNANNSIANSSNKQQQQADNANHGNVASHSSPHLQQKRLHSSGGSNAGQAQQSISSTVQAEARQGHSSQQQHGHGSTAHRGSNSHPNSPHGFVPHPPPVPPHAHVSNVHHHHASDNKQQHAPNQSSNNSDKQLGHAPLPPSFIVAPPPPTGVTPWQPATKS